LPSSKKTEHLKRCRTDCYKTLSRAVETHQPVEQLTLRAEDTRALDIPAIEYESKRCLNCGCDGVNPSDLAPALVVLQAEVVTNRRTIPIEKFWAADRILNPTVLEKGEIITAIKIPSPPEGSSSSFIKFALRKAIDFPIVNCAASVVRQGDVVKSVRVCLNAVYSNPYRAFKAEQVILEKTITEETAEAAGAAAVEDAIALPYNKFKIQIAKTMVKRALLGCR